MTEKVMTAHQWEGYVEGVMEAMIAVAKITGDMKIEDFNEKTWKMTCKIQATLAGLAADLSQDRHSGPSAGANIEEQVMTDEQIKHMVDRFLGWKLPDNFNPDGGISFKKTFNEHMPQPMKNEPIGTNLLDAMQADAMVRYMVDGMPQ